MIIFGPLHPEREGENANTYGDLPTPLERGRKHSGHRWWHLQIRVAPLELWLWVLQWLGTSLFLIDFEVLNKNITMKIQDWVWFGYGL